MEVEQIPLQVVVAIAREPSTGNLLFQERHKAPYKGYFGLVGGKVEPGEESEQSIIREFKEETGLKVNNLDYVQVVYETLMSGEKVSRVALHIYLVEASGQVEANLDEGQIHWVDEAHFRSNKNLYIPADWHIVNSVINNETLFSNIVIEENGNQYEIKTVS